MAFSENESVIKATIRSFFTCLAAAIGVIVGLALIIALILYITTSTVSMPQRAKVVVSYDVQGKHSILSQSTPAILRLDIHGVIGMDELTAENVKKILRESREGVLAHDRVKAIILHIDSPGGAATDSDAIYRALKEYKKRYKTPIYAFVDGLCASGGMYIACAADRIYANDTSVVGSVGVLIGPNFNFSGLMNRIGIESQTLTQGKDKDMLNPFRPWEPGEAQSLRTITKELYDQFVDVVLSARKRMTREALVDVYGAQVYLSRTAEMLGYIDVANSEYLEALKDVIHAAHIPPEEKVQVVTLEVQRPLLSELVACGPRSYIRKLMHRARLGSDMPSELSGKFLYLYQPLHDR